MSRFFFRAYDLKWDRWISPSDIILYGDGTGYVDRRNTEHDDVIESVSIPSVEISIMQYVGFDDVTSRKIYEGDQILLIIDGEEMTTPILVKYDYWGYFPFVFDGITTCRVVGNMFDKK